MRILSILPSCSAITCAIWASEPGSFTDCTAMRAGKRRGVLSSASQRRSSQRSGLSSNLLTPGEGITIYPIQSAALSKFEDKPERWLDLRWDAEESTPQRFPARIAVQSVNEPGSLAQIAQVIAEHDGNIDNIRMTRRAPDFTDVLIDLEVYDLKHLTDIIAQLRAKAVVAKAERVNG